MEVLTVLIVGILTLVMVAVVRAVKRNQYWADRDIAQYKPLPFVGNLLPVILKRKSIGELLAEIHRALPNEKVVGFYFFMKPILIINDIEMVERVLIKDFAHFTNRGPQPDISKNVQNMNLFNTNGNLWRAVRNKFSPMFTTGKLRFMFPQVNGIADSFMDLLEPKRENIDLNEYFGKYAMEIIATTAFGFEGKAMEENSEFREKGKVIFAPSLTNFVRFTLAPSLLRVLGISQVPKSMLDYFGVAVKEALKYRRETGTVRNDFIQHMLTLQQKGSVEIDKDDESDEILKMDEVPNMKVDLSDDLMVGQSMGFMVAGFDATALSMTWLCYEFAKNPEKQDKARKEVKDVLAKHGDRVDYNILREMKYLGYCLKENNRLHSPVSELTRMCCKPYPVPGTDHVIQPGDYIYVPSLRIHTDPEFFPEPHRYSPERWANEHENERPPCTYLPWGAGPRMCIAMRFATMEMHCVMTKILTKFEINLHPKEELDARVQPFSFFSYPRKRICFTLKKIE